MAEPTLGQHAGVSVPSVLYLQVTAGPCTKQAVDVPVGFHLTIGRTKSSKKDAHIKKVVIKDSSISERHAELSFDGATWTVCDVGSSCGTDLNGREMRQGVLEGLKDGDVLRLGTATEVTIQLVPRTLDALSVEELALLQATLAARALEEHAKAECSALLAQFQSFKAQGVSAT